VLELLKEIQKELEKLKENTEQKQTYLSGYVAGLEDVLNILQHKMDKLDKNNLNVPLVIDK